MHLDMTVKAEVSSSCLPACLQTLSLCLLILTLPWLEEGESCFGRLRPAWDKAEVGDPDHSTGVGVSNPYRA